jgi:hypothetical protein
MFTRMKPHLFRSRGQLFSLFNRFRDFNCRDARIWRTFHSRAVKMPQAWASSTDPTGKRREPSYPSSPMAHTRTLGIFHCWQSNPLITSGKRVAGGHFSAERSSSRCTLQTGAIHTISEPFLNRKTCEIATFPFFPHNTIKATSFGSLRSGSK